jgi:hypothetical protein
MIYVASYCNAVTTGGCFNPFERILRGLLLEAEVPRLKLHEYRRSLIISIASIRSLIWGSARLVEIHKRSSQMLLLQQFRHYGYELADIRPALGA